MHKNTQMKHYRSSSKETNAKLLRDQIVCTHRIEHQHPTEQMHGLVRGSVREHVEHRERRLRSTKQRTGWCSVRRNTSTLQHTDKVISYTQCNLHATSIGGYCECVWHTLWQRCILIYSGCCVCVKKVIWFSSSPSVWTLCPLLYDSMGLTQ